MSNCIDCTDITSVNICEDWVLGSVTGGVQTVTVKFENIADGSFRYVDVTTDSGGDITLTDLEQNVVQNVKYMVTIGDGDTFTLPDGTTVTSCVRLNFKYVKAWN
jgi:hypothetical protein